MCAVARSPSREPAISCCELPSLHTSRLSQPLQARWPGEHKAAAALQAQLTDAVSGDADLRQLAADAFRG